MSRKKIDDSDKGQRGFHMVNVDQTPDNEGKQRARSGKAAQTAALKSLKGSIADSARGSEIELESEYDNVPMTDRLPNTDRQMLEGVRHRNVSGSKADEQVNEAEIKNDDGKFEKTRCFGPICNLIRLSILTFSAFISFLVFTGDILYATKVPYYKDYMWPTIVILSMKCSFFLILVCNQIGKKGNEMVYANSSEPVGALQKQCRFFQNNCGIPLITILGLYRLLPSQDFGCEIMVGYLMEIVTSLVPMFSVQLMNNTEHSGHLSWLQATSTSLHLTSVLLFIPEILYQSCQFVYNYRMRKLGLTYYQPKTEALKMSLYGPRLNKTVTISFIITLLLLLLGLSTISTRTCPNPNDFLEFGVCHSCPIENCKACNGEPLGTCKECEYGYFMSSKEGKCVRCDSLPFKGNCQACKENEGTGELQCLECKQGFDLYEGTNQCVDCAKHTGVKNCAKCPGTKCDVCNDGFFLKEKDLSQIGDSVKSKVKRVQTCEKCDSKFDFCESCTEYRCHKCREHVATFDYHQQCTTCTSPWLHLNKGWPHCYCPHVVDVEDNYHCKDCKELIPGCKRCEYSKTKKDSELAVKVGWDPVLSAQGLQYIETEREDKPEYLVCREGNNKTTIDVHVNRQTFETEVFGCSTLIDGCAKCHRYEDQVACNKCNDGYQLVKGTKGALSQFGLTLKNSCEACGSHLEHCLECDDTGCLRCEATFRPNENSQKCEKCQYEWMCEE